MAGQFTEPRDLRPQAETDAPLRRLRDDASPEAKPPGRWVRESESHAKTGHEDSVTKSCRVYFFIMAAIIAAAIAVFLILHPQAGD
jgi:hypothetical protein